MKRFNRHERALERKLDKVIELLEEQNKLLLTEEGDEE